MQKLFFLAHIFTVIRSEAQTYTSGLSSTGSGGSAVVKLGGTLTGNTSIDISTFTFGFKKSTVNLFTVLNNGNIGIGSITTPTSLLHLSAGTATAGTAPLKFSSGVLLTTAEQGAMEYNGTALYFTPATTRKVIAFADLSNITGTLGVVNGGTGLTSVSAGDLFYGSASNVVGKLTKGTDGQVLSLSSGLPVWANPPNGTVTNVSPLTLGTSGTDLSSTIATGTTTPVITLNIPTASATNRGVLSPADWSTFSFEEPAMVAPNVIKNYLNGYKKFVAHNTDSIAEGSTSLYFSNARAQAAITGILNHISVTAGAVDISNAYPGQASITTVGTSSNGTWNGIPVQSNFGGTGQSTVTTGDLLYGSGGNTWGKLASGVNGQVLTINGGLPTWAAPAVAPNTGWSLNGNVGTTPPTNFIGTTDNSSLAFRTFNTERLRIDSVGRILIGPITGGTFQVSIKLFPGFHPLQVQDVNGNYLLFASGANSTGLVAMPSAFTVIGNSTVPTTGKLGVVDNVLANSGALSGELLNLQQTWNTTGAPTAIRLNVTNTASGSGALLMDLQVGGVSKFNVTKDGSLRLIGIPNVSFSSTNVSFIQLVDQGMDNVPTSAGQSFRIAPAIYNTPGAGVIIRSSSSYRSHTSSSGSSLLLNEGFVPIAGTGIYNSLEIVPTINQTGGANGVTRGMYINPILTSASDFRGIEFTNNIGYGIYGSGTAKNYLNGNLSIGTNTASTSSALTVESTTQGVFPRMTTAQRDAIASPAMGLMIWNTTDSTLNQYRGTAGWSSVSGATTIASQTGTGTQVVMSTSPTLTGVPLAPTATVGTNTTQIATTAFVANALSSGLSSSNFVFNENPIGVINGSNTTFTIANTPIAGTVRVYLSGVRQKLTTHYSISGTDIIIDYLK